MIQLEAIRTRPACSTANWYVIYVKSRHEFAVRHELSRKGVETFVPHVKRLRHWKDRKKLIDFPLFPGYVFVRFGFDPETYLSILKTPGIVTFVSLEGSASPSCVSDSEMHSLKVLMESGKEIDSYPHLKDGMRVRVKAGPLRTAEGILLKKEDQHMLLVNLVLLGRSVGVRVYADEVEAA
jgi:transcription antitermination factor NusG